MIRQFITLAISLSLTVFIIRITDTFMYSGSVLFLTTGVSMNAVMLYINIKVVPKLLKITKNEARR